MSLSKMFFFFMLLLSIIMMTNFTQIIMIWVALELNSMMFIGLLSTSFFMKSFQSLMKYFLIQSVAGIMFLLSSMMLLNMNNMIFSVMLIMSFFMKLGIPPFFFWIISVFYNMSWENLFILSTIQKIGPMVIMNQMKILSFVNMIFIVFFCVFAGFMGGLNSSNLRLLLAFSSITHLGWMFMTIYFSNFLFFFYLFSYSLILVPLFIFLNNFNLMSMKSSTMKVNFLDFYITMNMFNISGIPPFMGFIIKLIVIFFCLDYIPFSMLLLLLILTSLNAFYYLKIIFSLVTFNKNFNLDFKKLFSFLFFYIFNILLFFLYAMIFLD